MKREIKRGGKAKGKAARRMHSRYIAVRLLSRLRRNQVHDVPEVKMGLVFGAEQRLKTTNDGFDKGELLYLSEVVNMAAF